MDIPAGTTLKPGTPVRLAREMTRSGLLKGAKGIVVETTVQNFKVVFEGVGVVALGDWMLDVDEEHLPEKMVSVEVRDVKVGDKLRGDDTGKKFVVDVITTPGHKPGDDVTANSTRVRFVGWVVGEGAPIRDRVETYMGASVQKYVK